MDKRNLREVREAYEQIAAPYAQRSVDELRNAPFDRHLLDLLAVRVQGVVCDLGCGPGQVARYLRDQGVQQVVGVDLSPAMLEQARRLHPDIEFLEGNMYRLPVQKESWAAIVAFYSLIHIPRHEVPLVLLELRRVLRPGGLLLIAFHIGSTTVASKCWWDIPVSLTYTHFLCEEMQVYLQHAGFDIEAATTRPPYSSAYFSESGGYKGFVLAKKRIRGTPTR